MALDVQRSRSENLPPLLWLSLAWVIGVRLAAALNIPLSAWLALAALAGAVLVWPLWKRPFLTRERGAAQTPVGRWEQLWARWIALPPAVLLLTLSLGAARYQVTVKPLSPHQLAWYNDQESRLTLEGRVVEPPEERDGYALLVVQIERLYPEEGSETLSLSGRLLARLPLLNPEATCWRYGDRLRLNGYLHTPFENEEFSYRNYLAHRGILSTFTCGQRSLDQCAQVLSGSYGDPLRGAIYALRQRLVSAVLQTVPAPEGALLAGILFGVEGYIPSEVREAFNASGTAHIIAISGFNFAIIAALFVRLFGRLFGRWRGMLAALLGMAFYAVLAGAGAGVIRAAIMGSLTVFGEQLGRRQHGLNSLAFVAALMSLADPHVLWDVSFQLSFMATLGLMLYAQPLESHFRAWAEKLLPPRWVPRVSQMAGEYFLFTLAAQVTTLPLVVYYFHRFSLVSFLANPLILPAQPPLMVLGGIAALGSLLSTTLGQVAAWFAWPFAAFSIRVAEWSASLPWAAWTLPRFAPWTIVTFYALLLGATAYGKVFWKWWQTRFGADLSPWAWPALVGISLLNAVVWRGVLSAPDGRLHLWLLDVGEGEALLVRSPQGRFLLVNGGSSPNALAESLGRRLPFGNPTLDWWVIAATGEEQVAALPSLVTRYPPQQVLWCGPTQGSYSARQLRQALSRTQTPITLALAGHSLDFGDGARLEVLRLTAKGAVLLLSWERFSALLPIGLNFESMDSLLKAHEPPSVSALLLAEGGYGPLTPSVWVARWQPRLVLLSVAANDRWGRPAAETLKAIEGFPLLRTDWHGWIWLSTDGENLWVRAERR